MKTHHTASNHPYAGLPSVDQLLSHTELSSALEAHGRSVLTRCIRAELAAARTWISDGGEAPALAALTQAIVQRATQMAAPRLRRVINLTGTVLHTNLGRATLPETAVEALIRAARHPTALEYDVDNGKRGDRDDVVSELLCELTGAEAATVVNNNAAGVFLLLNTLGLRQEVIVSRGELVEIGGAFRVPDIMKRAGAKLVEVGTTNRTHLADFESAYSSKTALVMKVHTSNYAISGFTASVAPSKLAQWAHAHNVAFVEDLGSGTLVDLSQWGLPHEPTAAESIAAGADLVSFSGDKLLGGPQAGLLVGRADLIARIKKNPLKRALRVGKLTLAALEAVLRLYRDPDRLPQQLETLRLLTRSVAETATQAERLLPLFQKTLVFWPVDVTVQPLRAQIGSGSLPVERLDSVGWCIQARSRSRVLNQLEETFRHLAVPVLGRIHDNALFFDARCLGEDDEKVLKAQLAEFPTPNKR